MAPDSRTQISVKVVCGILLAFYALMPVAGCVFAGIAFAKRDSTSRTDAPDDPAGHFFFGVLASTECFWLSLSQSGSEVGWGGTPGQGTFFL